MIGRLIWNQDRPDIVFDTGTLYGGLHCGDCFAYWLDGRWLDVRLEYMNDWAALFPDFLRDAYSGWHRTCGTRVGGHETLPVGNLEL